MTVQPNLIFDLGVCNGDDSAYYLHKGYKVVGVEANPLLIPRLGERFSQQIREGRYELVSMGIAETEGEAEFWVCDDHAEWSSFDRSIASRNGCRHHAITIRTCRFRSLLERFGTPAYCKIDIEGKDDLCLEDMTPAAKPKYVSIEVIRGDRQIRLLRQLGYTKFKLISQRTLRQPPRAEVRLRAHMPHWALWVLINAEAKLLRHRFDGQWRFPPGASGSFGEETRGRWLTADEALELDRLLELGADWNDWFDIHAAD